MSRLIERPLARAHTHLAMGHFAEAIGAFRAALGIDPHSLPARLGLADAMFARGQREGAVDGLVEAAEYLAEHEQYPEAMQLYAKALTLAPQRLELHLDVAFVEEHMGRHDAAIARVEGLAETYMSTGRTDEAAELLRFAATWGQEEPEASTITTGDSRLDAPVSTETVVCATVLVRPDGTLLFGDDAKQAIQREREKEAMLTVERAISAPILLEDEAVDLDMVTTVDHPVLASPAARMADDEPTASRSAVLAFESEPTHVDERRTTKPVVKARPPAAPRSSTPAPKTAPRPAVASRPSAATPRGGNKFRITRAPRPGDAKPATASPSRPPANRTGPKMSRPSHARANPMPASRRAPIRPAPAPARSAKPSREPQPQPRVAPNPLVDRLRSRAGIGSAAAPRSAVARSTESISVRPSLARPPREEDATHRFRRPRAGRLG